jgi:hypothetical protein
VNITVGLLRVGSTSLNFGSDIPTQKKSGPLVSNSCRLSADMMAAIVVIVQMVLV